VQAVYAVAYRMLPSASTPRLDIGGGTGFACSFYTDRFKHGQEDPATCRLYLFDEGTKLQDPETQQRWNAWDTATETWQPMTCLPPKPSGIYAGIGASRISPAGAKAIEELFRQ